LPAKVALGHFLVHDAASGGHPLHVTGAQGAGVAEAVAMFDGTGQHIGNGLDAAVRMPGKALEVILRLVELRKSSNSRNGSVIDGSSKPNARCR
jgi:hypothetical protein